MAANSKRVNLDRSTLERLEGELRERALAEGTNLFPGLDELSSATVVEDIDIDESSLTATKEKGGWLHVDGVVNVYVTLNYGDKNDSVSRTDSFPGHFTALVNDTRVRLESTTVDTSSFYQ
jgi:hypothetical protein